MDGLRSSRWAGSSSSSSSEKTARRSWFSTKLANKTTVETTTFTLQAGKVLRGSSKNTSLRCAFSFRLPVLSGKESSEAPESILHVQTYINNQQRTLCRIQFCCLFYRAGKLQRNGECKKWVNFVAFHMWCNEHGNTNQTRAIYLSSTLFSWMFNTDSFVLFVAKCWYFFYNGKG